MIALPNTMMPRATTAAITRISISIAMTLRASLLPQAYGNLQDDARYIASHLLARLFPGFTSTSLGFPATVDFVFVRRCRKQCRGCGRSAIAIKLLAAMMKARNTGGTRLITTRAVFWSKLGRHSVSRGKMISKLRASAVMSALFAMYLGLATTAHAVPAPLPGLLADQQDGVFITDDAGGNYTFKRR